jgi:hypothetical protein
MPNNTQGSKEDLKEELIDSLKKSLCANKIKEVLKDLENENVIIPPTDHEKVMRFILLLSEENPSLFDNHPKNQTLKDFCRSCINKVKVNAEIKAKHGKW